MADADKPHSPIVVDGSWVIFTLVMGGEYAIPASEITSVMTALPKPHTKGAKKSGPSCLINAAPDEAGFEVVGDLRTIISELNKLASK